MPRNPKNYPSEHSHLTDGDWERIWNERIADPTYYDRRLCYAGDAYSESRSLW